MLIALPLLIGLALSLIRGGALRHAVEKPLRGASLLLLSLAIQIALYLPVVRTAPLTLRWGGLIYVAALGLMVGVALTNWRLGWGARLAALGLALNLAVIAANGGYMPENVAALRQARGSAEVGDIAAARRYHNTRLATPETPLAPLGDTLALGLPGQVAVYSPGDILLALGVGVLCYRLTRPPAGRTRTRRSPDAPPPAP